MELTAKQKAYIREHLNEDVAKLLLGAKKFPDLDVPFLAEQIASRRQIREKLPLWYANESLVFPAKITVEQCSSEQTALYKQRLVALDEVVCDLTGGLGIDSYYLSRKAKVLIYIERYSAYCEAARYNFQVLGAENIIVLNEDSRSCLEHLPEVNTFYIDPARRGEENKRVYALTDCEPDLPALLPALLQKAPRVIAKLSPMADLTLTESLLHGTVAIHILSVRNECKELLFEVRRDVEVTQPTIYCIDFTTSGDEERFVFTPSEERNAAITFASEVKTYLYEPNASVMKAGAFKSVALRFALEKLHVNSHLYTSDRLVANFPGRIFQVQRVLPFSGKLCKSLAKEIPQANVTIRNFPLSVDEFRKRTKIKDGGDVYLFATTLCTQERILIVCRKIG